MDESEAIIRVSCLLNRGSASNEDTMYFAEKPHDELVNDLKAFLERNTEFLGKPGIEVLQGPNDKGTDLILTIDGKKIGFQIKSHGDIGQDDFAMKVKAQSADSGAHGVIKWYLLICSPLNSPPFRKPKAEAVDNSKRIQAVISDFSVMNSSYVAVYGPCACAKIFSTKEQVPQAELAQQFHQWHSQPDDLKALIQELKGTAKPAGSDSVFDLSKRYEPQLPKTLKSISEALDWDEAARADSSGAVDKLVKRLEKLSPRCRELLTVVLEHADDSGMSVTSLQGYVNMTPSELTADLSLLEDRRFIDGEEDTIFVRGWADWDLSADLKEFSKKKNIKLKQLLVELRFDLLD